MISYPPSQASPEPCLAGDAWQPKNPSYAHRYRLPFPSGPVSVGVCQRCGDRKAFRNSFDESLAPWNRLRARKAARSAAGRRGLE